MRCPTKFPFLKNAGTGPRLGRARTSLVLVAPLLRDRSALALPAPHSRSGLLLKIDLWDFAHFGAKGELKRNYPNFIPYSQPGLFLLSVKSFQISVWRRLRIGS